MLHLHTGHLPDVDQVRRAWTWWNHQILMTRVGFPGERGVLT